MRARLEQLREAWANLSGREQRLLTLMGTVACVLILGTAVMVTGSALADVQAERDELREALAAIDRAAPLIEAAQRKEEASLARYRNAVPPLGSYVEKKAEAEGIELRQVNEQPDKQLGKYRRRHVRVRLTGVELRPVMRLVSSLYDGNVPVAVEQLDIEHYSSGDRYNVQLGLYAFDLDKGPAGAKKGK